MSQPAAGTGEGIDPTPFPGRVDSERLDELIALATETTSLDFKRSCDLSDPASKYEFVKDAAGMMSRPSGGYLVIGVDDHGRPIGHSHPPANFDESRLRGLLTRHLEGEVSVLSASHDVGGVTVTVVFVDRRPDRLFPIVKTDFPYTDAAGRIHTPLRAGDVFVRHGTSTRRWRSGDLPALIKPHVDAARREERDRLGEMVAEVRSQFPGQAVADGPIAGITWRLGPADFDTAVVELARRSDRAALRLLTLNMARDGEELIAGEDDESQGLLLDVLDRASTTLGYGVTLGDDQLLKQSLTVLTKIYGHCLLPDQETPADPRRIEVTMAIAARVLATIGAAVRLEEWWTIPVLALQPVGMHYVSWLRHALTNGYRANAYPAIGGAFIAIARQAVVRIPALRLDVADQEPPPLGEPPAPIDPVLDSICQADFLWCVLAALHGRGGPVDDYYPSFATLYERRTQPILRILSTSSDVRNELFPDTKPEDLIAAADQVLDSAVQAGRHFAFERLRFEL
jgi:hypothetical protein